MCAYTPIGPALVALSPGIFPINLPLSAMMPPMNIIPAAPGADDGNSEDLPAGDARVVIDASSLKRENDVALNIASRRLGERLTDVTILTDNGFGRTLNEMGRALVGKSGPSMKDRLNKVLNGAGIELPDWESGLEPLRDGDRRILKIQLDAPIPHERYVYYFFSQRGHPTVSLIRRIYEDERYRSLHARFIGTDLETLTRFPKTIHKSMAEGKAQSGAFGLGWGSSIALGIEIGVKQIIDSGGLSEVASIWNEDAERLLDLMWGYIEDGYRALSGGDRGTDALDNSYRSLMTYLDSR